VVSQRADQGAAVGARAASARSPAHGQLGSTRPHGLAFVRDASGEPFKQYWSKRQGQLLLPVPGHGHETGENAEAGLEGCRLERAEIDQALENVGLFEDLRVFFAGTDDRDTFVDVQKVLQTVVHYVRVDVPTNKLIISLNVPYVRAKSIRGEGETVGFLSIPGEMAIKRGAVRIRVA
jgi:hypothetical protein